MNQKKCPKCGENNPAEAVMCWACYTPLTGGAAVAAGAGGATMTAATTAVADHEEKEKKAVAPWQIGVIVGGLLIGIGFGAYQFMGSSSSDVGTVDANTMGGPPPESGPPGPPPGPGVDPNVPQGPSGGGGPIQPQPAPYQMVAAPNARMSWGIMAIVPTQTPVSTGRAASLAAFARRQYNNVRGWQGMQIYVFQDSQSAQAFNDYQAPRANDKLYPQDYASLVPVWSKCLVRYEYSGNKEKLSYPSRNANGWWLQKSS